MAPEINKLAPIQIVAPKINKMAPKINKMAPKINKLAPIQTWHQKLIKWHQKLIKWHCLSDYPDRSGYRKTNLKTFFIFTKRWLEMNIKSSEI